VSRRAIHVGLEKLIGLEKLTAAKVPIESQHKRIRKTGAGKKNMSLTLILG
jgi:hypothetical protein